VYHLKDFNKDTIIFQNEKENPIQEYFVYENDPFSRVATSMQNLLTTVKTVTTQAIEIHYSKTHSNLISL